jgi:DNA helicase II / ATP-dependent DNA helicase PcrA
MKLAKKGNMLISLDQINREEFQKYYVEGKKGLLICPTCSEPVRLYLSINKEPQFQHIISPNPCHIDNSILESPVQEESFEELNGIRLPKSRTITAVKPEQTAFKKAQKVNGITTFDINSKRSITHDDDYIRLLHDAAIHLDSKQAEAVTYTGGAMLILAGAGSGKTRVLTARTAYLLIMKKIDPRKIMLVTFTAKAAMEMKNRLLSYPQIERKQTNHLVTGTFHSLFFRILAHHYPEKWNGTKLLKKEWQRGQIIKEAGKELQLDEKEFAYDAALQQISFWKNSLISPDDVKPTSSWEEKTAILYKQYEQYKSQHDLFDFDDMLTGSYELFRQQPNILERYQNRFEYFLVDEFQDVNKVQYELIKLLSQKSKNVCAVGDDDQSIYAFRGSDPSYLRDFETDFPDAHLVILDENYRSSHSIVSTANRIIVQNKHRRPKNMKAQFSNDNAPILFFPENEEEEATMIMTDIAERIADGAQPSDFAILFRTNTASRAIFERLAHSSLPFTIDQDAESFYDRFIIKCMLSFLRLALNEDDVNAISNILPALFIKQSVMRDLKAESILNDCSLLECLGKVQTGYAFQEKKLKKVIPITRCLSSLTPLEAIDRVEKELGFQDFLKKRGNEGNRWDKGSDDLRDLRVVAQNFNTIHDFLDHADHMAAMNMEIKKQKNIENIKLSTIHRSKGLEYKIVYIIGVVDGSIPHDYALEALRSGDIEPLEEERRLLYVAVTRAKEQLYVSVPQKRRGKQAYSSRFLNPVKL